MNLAMPAPQKPYAEGRVVAVTGRAAPAGRVRAAAGERGQCQLLVWGGRTPAAVYCTVPVCRHVVPRPAQRARVRVRHGGSATAHHTSQHQPAINRPIFTNMWSSNDNLVLQRRFLGSHCKTKLTYGHELREGAAGSCGR